MGSAATPDGSARDSEFPGTSRVGIHEGERALGTESVLGKVGLILEAFSADNATLGISELARATGLAKATVFRLCNDMTALGLLDRHWSEFRLGMRLFELGALVQRQRILHEVAMPFLQDLRGRTNETVHLGIPQGGQVFYVARLAGHQSQSAPSRIAGRAPMHCSATGKVMLAYLPDALVDDLLGRPLAALTGSTIVVPTVLRAELAQVRERGYAVENEEMAVGFRSVAAPVFGPGRRLLGAVSVTGPTSRVSVEGLAGTVRAAAGRISDRAATSWDLV